MYGVSLVCKGDFAINSRSDRRGSCGISPYDGSVSLIIDVSQLLELGVKQELNAQQDREEAAIRAASLNRG